MIDELQLLSGGDIEIANGFYLHAPLLSEIRDMGEREYYGMVSTFCATPSDYKSILYDNFNTDYEAISDYDFFLMLWVTLASSGNKDISLILPGCKTEDFSIVQDKATDTISLVNRENGIIINEVTYAILVDNLRKLHGFEKHVDIAGNESTKAYLINKARKEIQRKKNDEYKPVLTPLISAMVNCGDFKYDHHTVWGLTIYQFMDSVKRIQKRDNSQHILTGIYTGNIDGKKIPENSYNWLGAIE